MNNDNQIKHHLYWIMRSLEVLNSKDYQKIYNSLMERQLNEETCEEIDKLVAHIKTNY